MNNKIVLSVSLAFIISFAILAVVLNIIENKITNPNIIIEEAEKKFYGEKDNKNKVFLIGSSHILALNTTYIENKLFEKDLDYQVFNLVKSAGKPSERYVSLDLILQSKPDIVVYGIADRDFQGIGKSSNELKGPDNPLPDPEDFFDELSWGIIEYLGIDFQYLQNPKLTSLMTINQIIKKDTETLDHKNQDKSKEYLPYPNTPFYKIKEKQTEIIKDKNILKANLEKYTFNEIKESYKNPDVIDFKNMIKKFQENNIETIIFTTPHSELYLDAIPLSNENNFKSILLDLENELDLKIYDLRNKYIDLDIWNDPTHVAINHNGLIYAEDIAQIIVNELNN